MLLRQDSRSQRVFLAPPLKSAWPACLLLGGMLHALRAAAQATTSVSSASAKAGQSVALNVVASSSGTTLPAALQWTMSYPSGDISGISIASGPVTNAAGKTLSCASSGSALTCIVYGLN